LDTGHKTSTNQLSKFQAVVWLPLGASQRFNSHCHGYLV
jgi:hypothetical protein